jgi:hypothetical protein
MRNFDYIGSALGLWPLETSRGDLRYVSGAEKIADEITSVMLIQPGEVVLHPSLGLAPELFELISNAQPRFWCFKAHEAILQHVDGISELRVYIDESPDIYNELKATIDFIPRDFPSRQTLTFGWYAYRGAIFDNDMEAFRRSISFNGTPFPIFKN